MWNFYAKKWNGDIAVKKSVCYNLYVETADNLLPIGKKNIRERKQWKK